MSTKSNAWNCIDKESGIFSKVRVCGAVKAPVGLLSNKAVLCSKMEWPRPDKLDFCAARYTLRKQCKELMAYGDKKEAPIRVTSENHNL